MTEEKEAYRNIFDAASKIERKKAQKEGSPGAAEGNASAKNLPPLTREDLAKKLDQCKKMHKKIADKIEEAFVKNNISPAKLRDYLSSPKNFTDSQWRVIEEQRRAINQMLARITPKKSQKAAAEEEEGEDSGKGKGKKPKKMQVKSRWISMR
jgi:hypothetical protein